MSKAMHLDVTTGYLIDPITAKEGLAGRQLRLTTDACNPMKGELHVDPNACGLDSFGDPSFCTKIAVRVHRVTLSVLEEQEGKTLYAIKAEEYTGPELRLALLPRRGTGGGPLARLLVMKEDGTIARLVNLERPARGAGG